MEVLPHSVDRSSGFMTSALERDLGFRSMVPTEEGLAEFVDWYHQEWRSEGKR